MLAHLFQHLSPGTHRNQARIANIWHIGGCIILVLLLVLPPVTAQEIDQTTNHRLYLPQLSTPDVPNVFGIEMSRISPATGLDLLNATGSRWVRRNGLAWKAVEPVEGGGYNWDAPSVKALEAEMINAAQSNLNLILVVRGSPRWAVAPYQADCAPVNPAKYEAFAAFLKAAVERYSKPPYNVKYWEIGNEPDAYLFTRDSVFGCWGIPDDPYYGGEAYGRALKTVATAMKAVNPNIKILNGGLLLAHPYDPARPDETRAGRFFEGMLRVGAGPSIDILSFHSYTYYTPSGTEPIGPTVDWRVGYLQGLLNQYNLPKLPLIRTEAALLCIQVSPECRWAQADLLTRLYVRTIRDNLLGTIWYVYDSDSYHSTALIEPTDVFVPRPAYFAYRQAASMLSGATYLGLLEGQSAAIEGYRFRRGEEVITVVWSDSRADYAIPAPRGAALRCYNRDGGAIACTNDTGFVRGVAQPSPLYIIVK